MRIKSFEEFIKEGLISKTIMRSKSGEIRKEEGFKVKTSIGSEIIIRDNNIDYEYFIKHILDTGSDGYYMGIDFDNIQSYSNPSRRKDIINGKDESAYLVTPNDHNSGIVAGFDFYENMEDDDPDILEDENGNKISKEDYLSIVGGIVEALRKTDISKTKGSYDSKYLFVLIDEDTLWNYESEVSDDDIYINDFKEFFEETFPDVELEYWSYNNYSSNIGMSIDYNNLLQFEKCKKFVHDFFSSLKETYGEKEEE